MVAPKKKRGAFINDIKLKYTSEAEKSIGDNESTVEGWRVV